MATMQLYIGSNNKTKKLELAKIEAICSRLHEGFTVYKAVGYWLGSKEKTAVVVITDDQGKIMHTIADLKAELEQDAIAYQLAPELTFF